MPADRRSRDARGSARQALILAATTLVAAASALVAGHAPAQAAPPPAARALAEPFSVPVFSKTAGFRHDSIPAGIAAIEQLGADNGFTVDATEDAGAFTDANLDRYAAVVWLSTTGDVLDADQQAAFERYIRASGGYPGIHAASDTEYSWAWYGDLVGAYLASHPANQAATVRVEDPARPSTESPPANAAVGATPKVGLFSLGGVQTARKAASFDYFRLSAEAVDDTAPVTAATVDGTAVEDWYTGPATVTLAATDNEGGSGVARTEYQHDGATTWTAYTEPIPVAGDGPHEVRFRSVDEAGNVEATESVPVKIDTTAPMTMATFAPPSDGGWHAGAVPVTLTSTDADSAVSAVEWSLDGGPWTPSVDVTGDGEHELLYRATDKAGNETTANVRFFVTTSFRDMQGLIDRFQANDGASMAGTGRLDGDATRVPGGRQALTVAVGSASALAGPTDVLVSPGEALRDEQQD